VAARVAIADRVRDGSTPARPAMNHRAIAPLRIGVIVSHTSSIATVS